MLDVTLLEHLLFKHCLYAHHMYLLRLLAVLANACSPQIYTAYSCLGRSRKHVFQLSSEIDGEYDYYCQLRSSSHSLSS